MTQDKVSVTGQISIVSCGLGEGSWGIKPQFRGAIGHLDRPRKWNSRLFYVLNKYPLGLGYFRGSDSSGMCSRETAMEISDVWRRCDYIIYIVILLEIIVFPNVFLTRQASLDIIILPCGKHHYSLNPLDRNIGK